MIMEQKIVKKSMPAAADLEMAVLGAMLIDNRAADIVFELIRSPRVFYLEKHQIIFEAIDRMFQRGDEIDLLTVSQELKAMHKLADVGGDAYLIDLSVKVGGTAHTEFHCRILLQMFLKRKIIGFNMQVTALAYDDGVDVFDILDRWQLEFDKVVDFTLTGRRTVEFNESLEIVKRDIERISNQTGPISMVGCKTGFKQSDIHTGGYRPGDLVILAARPGMGKTAKALKTAIENLKVGTAVGMISLEMSMHQLTARMVAINSNLHLSQILKDGFSKNQYWESYAAAQEEMKNWPIYIDDSGVNDITEIIIRAKAWKRTKNIGLLIIDYLQLMDDQSIKSGFNREAVISSVSRKLKMLVKQLQIPVIALSQLSRDVEKRGGHKRPQLSDLRESGAIEQDADIVEFLYRPGYYKLEMDPNDYKNSEHSDLIGIGANTEYIIEKFRGGSQGLILLKWVGDKTKFMDPTDENERLLPEGANGVPF